MKSRNWTALLCIVSSLVAQQSRADIPDGTLLTSIREPIEVIFVTPHFFQVPSYSGVNSRVTREFHTPEHPFNYSNSHPGIQTNGFGDYDSKNVNLWFGIWENERDFAFGTNDDNRILRIEDVYAMHDAVSLIPSQLGGFGMRSIWLRSQIRGLFFDRTVPLTVGSLRHALDWKIRVRGTPRSH